MAAVGEEEKNRKRRKVRARRVALAPISECSQWGDLPTASHSRVWHCINWWHLARLHVHTAGSRSPRGQIQRLESTVAHQGSERLQMIKVEQQQGAGARRLWIPLSAEHAGKTSAQLHRMASSCHHKLSSLCTGDNHFILHCFVYFVQGPVHKINMDSTNNSSSTWHIPPRSY